MQVTGRGEAAAAGRAAAALLARAESAPEMDATSETPAGTLPGDESPEVGGPDSRGLGTVFGDRERVWGVMGPGRAPGWLCPVDAGVQSWVLRL